MDKMHNYFYGAEKLESIVFNNSIACYKIKDIISISTCCKLWKEAIMQAVVASETEKLKAELGIAASYLKNEGSKYVLKSLHLLSSIENLKDLKIVLIKKQVEISEKIVNFGFQDKNLLRTYIVDTESTYITTQMLYDNGCIVNLEAWSDLSEKEAECLSLLERGFLNQNQKMALSHAALDSFFNRYLAAEDACMSLEILKNIDTLIQMMNVGGFAFKYLVPKIEFLISKEKFPHAHLILKTFFHEPAKFKHDETLKTLADFYIRLDVLTTAAELIKRIKWIPTLKQLSMQLLNTCRRKNLCFQEVHFSLRSVFKENFAVSEYVYDRLLQRQAVKGGFEKNYVPVNLDFPKLALQMKNENEMVVDFDQKLIENKEAISRVYNLIDCGQLEIALNALASTPYLAAFEQHFLTAVEYFAKKVAAETNIQELLEILSTFTIEMQKVFIPLLVFQCTQKRCISKAIDVANCYQQLRDLAATLKFLISGIDEEQLEYILTTSTDREERRELLRDFFNI